MSKFAKSLFSMRYKRNMVIVFLTIVLVSSQLGALINANAASVNSPALHVKGIDLVDEQGNKVVFHGTQIDSNAAWRHDGVGVEKWTTQEDFARIANHGGNVVEIHQVTWNLLMPTNATVDESVLKNYIDNYVLWAEQNNLYIILTFTSLSDGRVPKWMLHNFTDRYDYEAKFFDVNNSLLNAERQAVINAWLYITKRYAPNPYFVLGLVNEPYVANPILTSGYSLNRLTDNYVAFCQQAISTLRSNGINSLIILDAAMSGAPYYDSTYFSDVNDQNTMWERHAYAPTISDWKAYVDNFLNIMYSIDKPLFLGEFGFYEPSTGFIGNNFTDGIYTWKQIIDIQIQYCKTSQLAGWSWHEYPWIYGEWYAYYYATYGATTFTEEESNWLLSTVLTYALPSTRYTLTILSGSGGSTVPLTGQHQGFVGSVINAISNPNDGYIFDHWLLDNVINMSDPITITMNNNHTLQPFFNKLTTKTLGKTNIGAQADNVTGVVETTVRRQAPENGIIKSISLYVGNIQTSFRVAVYTDNNGYPSTLLGESNILLCSINQWNNFTGFNVPIVAGAYYWLGVQQQSGSIGLYADSVTSGSRYSLQSYGAFPANFPAGAKIENREYSIYATYTVNLPKVATPTFNPISGAYYGFQNVTIQCGTIDATIRYTTDGSLPSVFSTVYSNPILITSTTTLKVKAYKNGIIDSDVAAATYTILSPFIFTDGFESGSFSSWSLGSLTTGESRNIVSNTVHHGSYAGQFNSNGNGGTEQTYVYRTISSINELYSRLCIKVGTSGLLENDDRFYPIIFKTASNPVAFAGWRMVGGVIKWNLVIRDGTGWVVTYSTTTPVLNQWYSVELHWKSDVTAGLGELYVDGVKVCSASGKNTAYYGNVNQVQIGLPEIVNCATTQTYVDCCVISVSYIGPEASMLQVATPTFSPASGTYSTAQSIAIQCATNNATIRYTVDGSEPTLSSIMYSNPILVNTTTTIKAKAYKIGMIESNTASATYTITTSVVIFTDGFESGTFSAWNLPSLTSGETRSIASNNMHHGNYAGYFTSNGNGGTEQADVYKTIQSATELYARAYIKVINSGLLENDDRFYPIIFKTASNPVAFAGWRMVGGVIKWNLVIRDGTGWVLSYSSTSPVLNQWYCIELHWKKDSVNGLGELYVDGIRVCSSSNRNTMYYGDVNQVRFGLAEIINCGIIQNYVDCFAISPNYIGPESGPSKPTVHLESIEITGITSNLGSMLIDASVSYTLPNNIEPSSSFTVNYANVTGTYFDHWETSGGVSVADILSFATIVTVSDSGVLRAVYREYSSTALFTDGFESGTFSAWNLPSLTSGESRNVISNNVHDGIYAGYFASNGNGGFESASCYKTFDSQNELYLSGSFRVAASGLVESEDRFYMMIIKTASNPVAFAGWRMVNGVIRWNLVIRDGTGWVSVVSSSSPSLNVWYDIELHWKSGVTAGLGELYVNGELVCSAIAKNTAYYGSALRIDFGLPEIVNCVATQVYADSCRVSVNPI